MFWIDILKTKKEFEYTVRQKSLQWKGSALQKSSIPSQVRDLGYFSNTESANLDFYFLKRGSIKPVNPINFGSECKK